MPSKPKRPCSRAGCRKLTTERYCDEHQLAADQERKDRHRYYDRHHRDKKAAMFYKSVAWRRLREQALMRDHGLCQGCLECKRITPATEVDHIVPIRVDWGKRLKLENLQSLCHKCHMKKTAEDRRRYGER